MKIKILFFGIARDIADSSAIEMEVKDDLNLIEVKKILLEKFPEFTSINDFSLAVNEAYIDKEYTLKNNDVVAIIPLDSGG